MPRPYVITLIPAHKEGNHHIWEKQYRSRIVGMPRPHVIQYLLSAHRTREMTQDNCNIFLLDFITSRNIKYAQKVGCPSIARENLV